jgi:hypothetical protein
MAPRNLLRTTLPKKAGRRTGELRLRLRGCDNSKLKSQKSKLQHQFLTFDFLILNSCAAIVLFSYDKYGYTCRPKLLTMLRAIVAVCLLLCVFQNEIIAQTYTYPGFIVKKNGETVKGVIGISNEEKAIRQITFKQGEKTEILNATDIAAFGRDDIDYCVAATITYHTASLERDQAGKEYSDKTTTETMFLVQLVKGIYSLYEIETNARKYYFISKGGGPVLELLTRVKLDESNALVEEPQYKNMLIAYANESGNESLMEQIRNITYNDAALKRVIVKLNGNSGSSFVKNTFIKSSRIEIGAGGIITNFTATSVKGDQSLGDLLSGTNFSSSTSPRIQVGLQFASNERYKMVKGLLALGYSTAVFQGSSPNISPMGTNQMDFYKKFSFLDLSLGAMISFTPAKPSSFFVEPFVSCTFITNGSTVHNTSVSPNFPVFNSMFSGAGFGLGYSASAHRIELRGERTFNNFSDGNAKVESSRISLTYNYTLFRF